MRYYELLVEEYKVVLNYVLEAENIVLKWERTFLLVNGVIFGLFVQVLMSDRTFKLQIIVICGVVGAVVSRIWYLIQARSYLYKEIRESRLKNIELLMRKLKPKIHAFALILDTEKYIEENKAKIEAWKLKSTYKLRTNFPLLIFWLWILLSLFSFILFYLLSL